VCVCVCVCVCACACFTELACIWIASLIVQGSDAWSGEQYEESKDKVFEKFSARVSREPTQCVRYAICWSHQSVVPDLYSNVTEGGWVVIDLWQLRHRSRTSVVQS